MGDAWKILSQEPKEPEGVLNDGIIMRFDRYLDFELLSKHYDFSIDMLRIYQHRVKWAHIVRRQKLSEYILREMAPNFDDDTWGLISKYYDLNETFIHDFSNKVDWENILLFQTVSADFLNQHKQFMPKSDESDSIEDED